MKDIDLLLVRYFSGEATEKEQTQLVDWIDQDPKNQLHFDQLTALFEKVVTVESAQEPNLSKGLEVFRQHMQRKNKLTSKRIYWYVSVVAACLFISLGLLTWFKTAENSLIQLAQAKEHLLPDGTKVTLSENSLLQFDEDFGKDNRNLQLQGQAFFVVAKQNVANTFLVHVGDAIIEDIGTSFQVMANYPNDSILVTVTEGKVLFYTPSNKGIVIEAGASGVFYPTKQAFLLHDKNVRPLSRHLHFSATPLREVVAQLNQAYGTQIVLEEAIADETITVEFNNQELDWILDIIVETLDLRLIKKDNHYEVRK